MKLKLLALILICVVLVVGIGPSTAFAQAYNTSFTSSITYQNVGAGSAQVTIQFYTSPSTTSPILIQLADLPKDAGTSLFIGSLSQVSSGFMGSAVMSSSEPLLATVVQIPMNSSTVKNRPLSNGFSSGQQKTLIPTVLKNTFDTHSVFGVQNAGNSQTTVTIDFFNTSAVKVHSMNQSIQPGAGYIVDAGQISQLGGTFNGSAVITGGSPSDMLVSTSTELAINGTGAYAFEGMAGGAKKVFMPTALCNAFGASTFYAIQNTNLSQATDVTVTYSNGRTDTQTIGPGSKKSFATCSASNMPAGFSGAAEVNSTTTDVVAIGKAVGSGITSAFVGVPAGDDKLALPYVRWATTANYDVGNGQRTFIAIQNVGSSPIPGGQIQVKYIDPNGVVSGTHTISGSLAAGAKVNSNPSNAGLSVFGIWPNGTFGGSAIVQGPGGAELAVIARVQTKTSSSTSVAEDYNGMALP